MQASIVASAQRAPCVSASLKPAAGTSSLRQNAFFGSKLSAAPKPAVRRANPLLKVQARGGGAGRQITVGGGHLIAQGYKKAERGWPGENWGAGDSCLLCGCGRPAGAAAPRLRHHSQLLQVGRVVKLKHAC